MIDYFRLFERNESFKKIFYYKVESGSKNNLPRAREIILQADNTLRGRESAWPRETIGPQVQQRGKNLSIQNFEILFVGLLRKKYK